MPILPDDYGTTGAGGLQYKGETQTITTNPGLPTTGQQNGDMWYVVADNDFKVWNSTSNAWDTIDMPNPSTTGSSTFDAEAVGNQTQINLNEFSATKTYPVGHIVTYQNQLYRCTTAITTAGAWNATNWTLVGTHEGTPYCHFSVGGSEIPRFNNLFDGTLYNVNKSELYIDSGTDFTTGMLVLNNGSSRIIGIITTISATTVGILPLAIRQLSNGIQGSSIVTTYDLAGGGQPPAYLRLKSLNLGAIVSFTPYAEYANSQRSFIFKITRGLPTDPQPRLAISVLSLSNSTVDDFKVFIDPTAVNTDEYDFYVQASGSSGSSITGILTLMARTSGDNPACEVVGSSSVPSGVIELTKIDNTGIVPPAKTIVWDYKGQGQVDQTVLNDFYNDKTFTLLSVVGVTTFYNTSDTIAPKEGDLIRVGSGNGNAGLAVIPANTATWTATTASGVTTWKPDADMVCQLINHNAASSVKGFWCLSSTNFPTTSGSFTMDFQTGTYGSTGITGNRGGNSSSYKFLASGDLFMDAQGQIAIIDIADYTGANVYNPRPIINATIVWTRYNVESSAPIKPPVRWFVNTKANIRDGSTSNGRWNGYVTCPATNMTLFGGLGTGSNVSGGARPKEGDHVIFADGTVVALSYVDSQTANWTVTESANALTYTGTYTGSAAIVQRPGLRKVIYVDSAYNGATGLNQNGVGSIFAPYKNLQAVIDNNDIITGAGQVIYLAAGTSTPAPTIPIAASNWTIQGDMAGQASRAEITTLMSIGGTDDVNHVGIKGVQFSLTGGDCVEINLNPDKTTYFENCNFKGDIDIRGDGFVSFTDCDVMGDIKLQGNVTVSLDRVQNENGRIIFAPACNATLITKNCISLTIYADGGTHIEEGNSTYITSNSTGTDNDTYAMIYTNHCNLVYLNSGSAIDRNLQYLPIKIGENVEYFLGTFAFQNTADSQTSASAIDPAAIRLDGGLSSIQIIDRIQRSGYTLASGAVGYLNEHLDAISNAISQEFIQVTPPTIQPVNATNVDNVRLLKNSTTAVLTGIYSASGSDTLQNQFSFPIHAPPGRSIRIPCEAGNAYAFVSTGTAGTSALFRANATNDVIMEFSIIMPAGWIG